VPNRPPRTLPCFPSHSGNASLPTGSDRAFISKYHQTSLLHCQAASFNAPSRPSLLSFLRQKRLLAGLATAKVLFSKDSTNARGVVQFRCHINPRFPARIRRSSLLRLSALALRGIENRFVAWSLLPRCCRCVPYRSLAPSDSISYRVVGPVNVISQSYFTLKHPAQ
jgi:hypothetical protein